MTRPLAVALAALAVHVGLGLAVRSDPILPGDAAVVDLVAHLRFAFGVDVVAVLTDLGAFPVAAGVVLVTGLWASRHGRRDEAVALLAGFIGVLIAVQLTKETWGRPRPEGLLTGARGLSYPSGHAAYATAWVAAALTTGRRGLIALAAVLVVAVMASRLYLHVHYLSDVVGGAALGVALFAAVRALRS